MLKALYITCDGLTDPLGQSQIIPYLKGLSKNYSIHILSAEKSSFYSNNKENIKSSLGSSNILWHTIKYRNQPPIIGSFLMQKQLYNKAHEIFKKENFDIIHCRSYPASLIGMNLSKKFKKPFIFDMRGFWADERIDRHIWNKKNPAFFLLYQYFKNREKKLLKSSAHIITLTKKAKEILRDNFSIHDNKVTVIPCAADLNFFRPPDELIKKEYRKKLNIKPEEKTLVYVGSTGSCYLIKEMLKFYKYGLTRTNSLKMIVFSPESGHNYIKKTADNLDIDNNQLVCKFIPRKELPMYLSAMDFSVMFFERSFSIQGSSPTKLGELMGMNIPVVVNSGIGDIDNIVQENKTGYIVKKFSKEEFNNAWDFLLNCAVKPEDFNKTATNYFSLNSAIHSFQSIYKNLNSNIK